MTDREKVIKGLRCMSTPYDDLDDRDCENCKYDNASCFLDVTSDALSLLKAQEPRVMTLDELRAVEPGTVLWETQNNFMPAYPVEFKGFDQADEGSAPVETIEFGLGFDEISEYGKQYVLWTAKPTEEQMEEVKWDG